MQRVSECNLLKRVTQRKNYRGIYVAIDPIHKAAGQQHESLVFTQKHGVFITETHQELIVISCLPMLETHTEE